MLTKSKGKAKGGPEGASAPPSPDLLKNFYIMYL